MTNRKEILAHFRIQGEVTDVEPLGNGLINDTFRATTVGDDTPDYVLQRINTNVFTDVDLLQRNIETVTSHIRHKLELAGEDDIDRKVLRFIPSTDGPSYWKDSEGNFWRVSVFIVNAHTYEAVTPEYSRFAGQAFGKFEALLSDLPEGSLGETIPDFHNLSLRYRQLHEAMAADTAGRTAGVTDFIDEIEKHYEEMNLANVLYDKGLLPKRICHCDTKVNNMMFDDEGRVLCVVDLDTTMPSFVFSDYGDFLRSAANAVAEDEADLSKVAFRMDIFKAFTDGYLQGAGSFLTPVEIENLPYAAALFPYMQSVRFLTDYLNGDVYWKTAYPTHNLVRAQNQWQLFLSVLSHKEEMECYIKR